MLERLCPKNNNYFFEQLSALTSEVQLGKDLPNTSTCSLRTNLLKYTSLATTLSMCNFPIGTSVNVTLPFTPGWIIRQKMTHYHDQTPTHSPS